MVKKIKNLLIIGLGIITPIIIYILLGYIDKYLRIKGIYYDNDLLYWSPFILISIPLIFIGIYKSSYHPNKILKIIWSILLTIPIEFIVIVITGLISFKIFGK